MTTIDTVVIGAGQAGLAVSRCLSDRGIEHVVLERGRVGQRWAERWDSLRLLSPNWMTRLPGWQYQGTNADGFMTRLEVQHFLESYAQASRVPVEESTNVRRVTRSHNWWDVETNRGLWRARHAVIATGHSQETRVPLLASRLPISVRQITTDQFRNPAQIAPGGVLIVGASASGVQFADALVSAGHPVTLAVGRHTRLPRRYRGRDIMFWLDAMGTLRKPLADMPDRDDAVREPSLQLVGNDFGQNVDLIELQRRGVRMVGRLLDVDDDRLALSSDLPYLAADADHRMAHLLARIDRHITGRADAGGLPPPDSWRLTSLPPAPTTLSLRRAGISTLLWATGYRRSYPWLQANVFDAHGEVRQHRGRTPAPGLFIVGVQFMIRRNSSFIDGVGDDAAEIAQAIAREVSPRTKEAA